MQETLQQGWYWYRDDTGQPCHISLDGISQRFAVVDDAEEWMVEVVAGEMRDRYYAAFKRALSRMAATGEPSMNKHEIAEAMGLFRQQVQVALRPFLGALRAAV